ncbi:MAG: helix-turn-helix domain-containing protein [Lachnospiraceae bacterium]|nr:helix-turn-helix domain-containing protein [Lachnospiraceae bacterium]
MAAGKQLDKMLEELRRATGLPVVLENVPEGGDEDAAGRVGMLLAAWRDRYDRGGFLKMLLSGETAGRAAAREAARFHIPAEGRRRIYAVECADGGADAGLKVLKAMFIRRSGDLAEAVDENRLILIRPEEGDDPEEARSLACTVADMLGAEAMVSARVGYADPVEELDEFAAAYRDACTALEIGKLFYSGESVFAYSGLGLGRIVYDLPEQTCLLYLKEVFGDGTGPEFDGETEALINAFYANNLNISEAARQLYLHRNTLVYRLEKLRQQTGLDLRNFEDAEKLNLARMISMRLRAEESAKE